MARYRLPVAGVVTIQITGWIEVGGARLCDASQRLGLVVGPLSYLAVNSECHEEHQDGRAKHKEQQKRKMKRHSAHPGEFAAFYGKCPLKFHVRCGRSL
jgi:hypothetical protein